MNTQRIIIITGMHRSGTSLVSSILQKAGIHMGDELIGAFKGNPHGHFEDADFVHFHNKVLQRFGQNHLVQDIAQIGQMTAAETTAALELIDKRRAHPIWGWKDPRTALFPDFWHTLLPKGFFIFIYRQPVEVVLSLLRRGIDLDIEVLGDPPVGLHVWQVYNESILNFWQQHPESCLLANITGVATDINAFINLAAKKFDLPLHQESTETLYHANELKQIPLTATINSILEQIVPEAAKLYVQLEAQADLPSPILSQFSTEETSPLVKLEQSLSNLTSQGKLSEEQCRYHFSHLLTLLDPHTILAGKEALDQIRKNHIINLEAHTANLETIITNLKAHTANFEAHTANLETIITNLKAHTANFETHTANLETIITNLKAHTANLEEMIANKDAHIEELGQKLAEIESTKAWQLTQKWYSFKQFLAGVQGRH